MKMEEDKYRKSEFEKVLGYSPKRLKKRFSTTSLFITIVAAAFCLVVFFVPKKSKYHISDENSQSWISNDIEENFNAEFQTPNIRNGQPEDYSLSTEDTEYKLEKCTREANCKLWSQQKENSFKCFLLYVNIPFCVADTVDMAGVFRRIASFNSPKTHSQYSGLYSIFPSNTLKNMGKKKPENCAVLTYERPRPSELVWFVEWGNDRKTAFTFIKEPHERALEAYYHKYASSNPESHSDERVLEYLNEYTGRGHKGNFMVHWLDKRIMPIDYREPKELFKVIDQYNMIGLAERIDESLVVSKIVFGLKFSDILRLPKPEEESVIKPRRTAAVNAFLEKAKKSSDKSLDRRLWEAANLSLDASINDIGEKFQKELRIYRSLLKQAAEFCDGKEGYPASKDTKSLQLTTGEAHFPGVTSEEELATIVGEQSKDKEEPEDRNCFFENIGCGRTCLKEFVKSEQYKSTINQ